MPTPKTRKKRPAPTAPVQPTGKTARPALRQLIAAQFAARSVSLPRMNHPA